jgi:hypothetical protein
MSQPTIPQAVQNIAADTQIDLPPSFSRIELTAAIFTAYRDNHGVYPDRHQFQAYSPAFVKSLPGDKLEAAAIIATAAGDLLGLPGIKSDSERIQRARETIAAAEADAAEAEASRGQRMSRIHSLEQIIKDLTAQRAAWEIDFSADTALTETSILENWGRGYQINGPFNDLQTLAVLKKLQPAAYKMIDAKLADAQGELDQLKLA